MYKQSCVSCGGIYRTYNINVKSCGDWDCIRIALIKAQPELTYKVRSLARLAEQWGLVIARTDNGVKVIDLHDDTDARWRDDLNKVRTRLRRDNPYTSENRIWDVTARNVARRASAKYRTNRRFLLQQKGLSIDNLESYA